MKKLTTLYIIISMMIYSCSSNSEQQQSYDEQAVPDTIVYQDTNQYQQTPVQQLDTAQQINIAPISPTQSDDKEIVHFRVQNSFNNSDKTHSCFISIDDNNRIMTLKALNGVDEFTLSSEGGNIFILNYYNNAGLQATKTVYRRIDLEDESEAQIYTSRTGEIILTLSYE